MSQWLGSQSLNVLMLGFTTWMGITPRSNELPAKRNSGWKDKPGIRPPVALRIITL
jgi:hypothetical protein